ncbi:MAG: DUF3667 domain-containing protein [Anaeromyxobacter sp.]
MIEPSEAAQAAEARCPNCDAPLAGRWCAACGQDQAHDLRRPLRRFLGEVLEEAVSLDSRFAHTLGPLLLRPGHVAAEMIGGRRARYSSPVRLYLLASLLFFLATAVAPEQATDMKVDLGQEDEPHLVIRLGGREEAPAEQAPAPRAEGGEAAKADQADQAVTAEGTAELSRSGALGAWVATRVDRLKGLPRSEVQRRFQSAFHDHAPAAVFVLVPILAALLKLAHRRRFYAEHLLLALHAQTVGFLLLLPGLWWPPLTLAGVLAAACWTWLALRRLHREGALRTTAKLAAVGVAYMLALSVVLTATAVIAVLAV